MPNPGDELQELLDSLEAEEADEEKGTTDKPKQESSVIKQLRGHIRRLERDNKAADAEREELRKFRDETTAAMQSASLLAAGLSPRQSEVFLKAYDTVTPESIAAFKTEVLGAASSEGETEATERFVPTGFVGEYKPKPLSKVELEELWRKNPVKAQEMLAAGQVQFRKGQGN
jgi:hypothetical protein